MVGIRPTRAPADVGVRVESAFGANGEVDDGSLGSRVGPVDREHFYSVKVCFCFFRFPRGIADCVARVSSLVQWPRSYHINAAK